tara:strand:+ start:1015 stop:2724 length:1710 start_codon:yes stop_codon:yes gene_type:complete
MSSINQLLESANPWRSLQSDAGKLANKWVKTGLLENLSEVDKNNMSILLENQAKQLVVENSATGQGSSAGTFTVGQSENWAGIALPMVRKVFSAIAAKEFVSVQPMNLPSGLVFFLDFQYGTDKSPFASGDSLYGARSATGRFPFQSTGTTGGLYGAGRFAYSTNQFSASVPLTGSTNGGALPTVGAGTGSFILATWAEVNLDSDLSASAAGGRIYKITTPTASLSSFDPDAVRAFVVLTGSLATVASALPAFTTYNYTAGTISFFVTASSTLAAGVAASYMTVEYNKTTADNNRGDFEDTSATSFSVPNAESASTIVIPEINIKMQSQAITAKTKKLKAVWTPEFAQDLNAYQNIDAEAELTNIMSEYISMEIDLEILDMLIEDAAAGTEYWSVINNTTLNSAGTDFTASLGFYNTQGGWFQTLGTKMQKLSNKIHQLTLRGGANFLVCSPTVATILESIPGFAANTNGDAANMEYAMGVQKIGAINNRYTVYKNPYMTENVILMGFRGKQFLETGAVFAPYIPLIMTPLVYDPNTFTPRKGLMTRYAKKMLRPEFYAKIYVSGLNTL